MLEADVNANGPSYPGWFAVFNNDLYFQGRDDINGSELWKFSGGVATLVTDINPGTGHASPRYPTVYQNELYFTANDGTHGSELWKFDGNTTTLVEDLNIGAGSSSPRSLTVYNGKLLFWTGNSTNGYELWSFNGVNAQMQGSIDAGGSIPSLLKEFNTKLYFRGYDNTHGFELWSFDGSSMILEADINPGVNNSYPDGFTEFQGKLYFHAGDANGVELWSHDGSTTTMEADIYPGPESSNPGSFFMSEFNGKLFFGADDGLNGIELWSYNGANANLEADIITGSAGSYPVYPIKYAGKLFFFAAPDSDGFNLWSYDGISAVFEADVVLPTDIDADGQSNPILFDNKLFFAGYDEIHENEVWSFKDPNTGIDLTILKGSTSPYPNPTTGNIQFHSTNSGKIKSLRVFNSLGVMVEHKAVNGTALTNYKLSGPAGFYLVQISFSDGTTAKMPVMKQ